MKKIFTAASLTVLTACSSLPERPRNDETSVVIDGDEKVPSYACSSTRMLECINEAYAVANEAKRNIIAQYNTPKGPIHIPVFYIPVPGTDI